jgi:hypothetical protein
VATISLSLLDASRIARACTEDVYELGESPFRRCLTCGGTSDRYVYYFKQVVHTPDCPVDRLTKGVAQAMARQKNVS